MMRKLGLLIIISGFFLGCSPTVDNSLSIEEQYKLDLELIDAYILENEIADILIHSSEIRYTINETGSGISPKASDVVKVDYTGKFLESGVVFDSNTGAEFILNGTISGWIIMVQEMHEGDSFTIYLPSFYAYGKNGSGSIPPNSVLIFDIKLIRVGN